MEFVRIQVDAYAGHRGNERPRSFEYEGRQYQVTDVIDRWYEGGLSPRDQRLDYYKVRTADNLTWMLRYNARFDVWSALKPA